MSRLIISYFGHLIMQRPNYLKNSIMLRKVEEKRRQLAATSMDSFKA